ncbi:MAG: polyphosphate kinase 1 [Sulfuricellaceae bacterium]|nr:polyphosphate kinase 1 [Sulfuricellaceae bacterium]
MTTRFNAPEYFINRELSQLAFNRRVLEQAMDDENPLLERLKFLCIVSSNMDEFFEVRVAGLKEQLGVKGVLIGPEKISPQEAFQRVSQESRLLVDQQYKLLNEVILPAMARQDIRFLRRTHWSPEQSEWIKAYFFREVMPVLTPIGLDPAHPFPRVINKSLNFAVELEGKDAFGRSSSNAIVQAPRVLPRVIQLPKEIAGHEYGFVFLSSILHAHVNELFNGMNVKGCYQFRVTRNSNLFVDEEEVTNLRAALQGELSHRHYGNAVRLEVADNCSPEMTAFLLQQFGLGPDDLYQVNGLVNLVRLFQIPDRVDRPDLKYPSFVPGLPDCLDEKQIDMFQAIRHGDVLVHQPFQSFNPVIEFLTQAAMDPNVLAIKQTVYRTGSESVLMDALIKAAQNGKEVTVVVELMARFDEEANINWAAQLEEAGAHVVYGVVGYKTHAKMLLIVRREENRLRRYVHLGTGNYHPRTAKLYTDFGLFTCNDDICSDASDVFAQLTGVGKATKHAYLWQSPFTMHPNLLKAIRNEAANAKAGLPAAIIGKMNSLLEPEVIQVLYEASCAGVKIDLIVRGVCALRPGIPGVSENIRVRSVIGRFLEHSRIFYFRNNGAQDVYISSADWMGRNLLRRIEVACPVLDPRLKKRVIKEGLEPYLKDNTQTWEMDADGSYRRKSSRRSKPVSAQSQLLESLGVHHK